MNKIYNNSFYNPEQKERYLKGLSKSTKEVYSRVLKRASYVEEELGKDLFNFNINEISQVMKVLSPTTQSSSSGSIAIMKKYIGWAIKNDLRADNINPLDAVVSEEFISSFVDRSGEYIYTEQQINNIVGGLANAQDAAMMQSLFEGLMGREYSEILHLSMKDINEEECTVKLKNVGANGELETRILKVSEKLITLLLRAGNQTNYVKSNGNMAILNKARIISMVENGYIFRSADMNTTYFGVAPSNLLSRRLKNVGSWFGYPELVPLNVRKSGMVKYAKDLYEEQGKLDREEVLRVCDRFGLSVNAVHRLTKDCLNIQTINRLYPSSRTS